MSHMHAMNGIKMSQFEYYSFASDRMPHEPILIKPDQGLFNNGTGIELLEKVDAVRMANQFVREEINTAMYYQKIGQRPLAMLHLGYAIHTVVDSTSEQHHDFKVWKGNEWIGKQIVHGALESFYPNSIDSNFARATRDVINIFLGKAPVPDKSENIFSRYKADDSNSKYYKPAIQPFIGNYGIQDIFR